MMSRREAAPLACTLGLALLAASAAPGHTQTAGGSATPAAPAAAAAQTADAAKPAATGSAADKNAAGQTTTAAQGAGAKASATGNASATTAGKAEAGQTAATATKPVATATSSASTPKAAASKTAASKSAGTQPGETATATTSGTPGKSAESAKPSKASGTSEGDYTLRGGQEGTVFKSLTVEGEDRVHIDFERPELKIDLDMEKAPGLDWGSAADVLNRTNRDLQAPLTALSAKQMTPYLARPWLNEFATGPVARFHPDAQGVERWKLVVVNSKGDPVASFAGKGDPPREIVWDGRATNGTPVTPGLTYSYVFEAYDKAGNKRNVVGQGFTVSAYRIDSPEGQTLLFSGAELQHAAGAQTASAAPGRSEAAAAPPILLEAASWLNQMERLSRPIRVTASARSLEQADALAGTVKRTLAPLVLGDPDRLDAVAVVEPDAPQAGTVSIAPAR